MKNELSAFDEVDLKILNLLQDDAKLTAKNLGDQIALSQTPVYERIKKLEKSGAIRKYVALLEPELLNKNLIVFLNVTIHKDGIGSRDEIIEKLTKLPEISELYCTSGQYDFVAKIRVSKVSDYKDFLLKELSPITNIKEMVSHIVLEEIKYTTSIL